MTNNDDKMNKIDYKAMLMTLGIMAVAALWLFVIGSLYSDFAEIINEYGSYKEFLLTLLAK